MAKESLETRTEKGILEQMSDKIEDIDNVLRDLSMKLCYFIRGKRDYYRATEGPNYE